jgi:hypothetical protein
MKVQLNITLYSYLTRYCSLSLTVWYKNVRHKEPVIQGVSYVAWGNSRMGRKAHLVAGFLYPKAHLI